MLIILFVQKLLVDRSNYPDIHYLGIDRPGRMRPDAVRNCSSEPYQYLTLLFSTQLAIVFISWWEQASWRSGHTTSGSI